MPGVPGLMNIPYLKLAEICILVFIDPLKLHMVFWLSQFTKRTIESLLETKTIDGCVGEYSIPVTFLSVPKVNSFSSSRVVAEYTKNAPIAEPAHTLVPSFVNPAAVIIWVSEILFHTWTR
jgi:hypothetical protein